MSYRFDPQQIFVRPSASRWQPSTRPTPSGQSLDPAIRLEMEARFQHDFSNVRVCSDAEIDAHTPSPGSRAYTQGQQITFRPGYYAPHTAEGKMLLAHELAHVVQQRNPSWSSNSTGPESEARQASQRVKEGNNAFIRNGVPQGSLQRDNGSDDEERRFRLRTPQLGEGLGYRQRRLSLGEPGEFQLRLDPQIQAQIRAIQFVRGQLSLESLEHGISQMSGSEPTTGGTTSTPDISPGAAARSAMPLSTRPNPFSIPATPTRPPLVPAGRGPDTPRPANVGHIFRAVLRIPAVRDGITRLQDQATTRLRHDWSSLSTGERVLLVGQGVLITGGALTGVALSPDARQFALDQIQGRDIPIPGLPVTFRFNATGENQYLMIGADLGRFLPRVLR